MEDWRKLLEVLVSEHGEDKAYIVLGALLDEMQRPDLKKWEAEVLDSICDSLVLGRMMIDIGSENNLVVNVLT